MAILRIHQVYSGFCTIFLFSASGSRQADWRLPRANPCKDKGSTGLRAISLSIGLIRTKQDGNAIIRTRDEQKVFPGLEFIESLSAQAIPQHDQAGLLKKSIACCRVLTQILRNSMQPIIKKADLRVPMFWQ